MKLRLLRNTLIALTFSSPLMAVAQSYQMGTPVYAGTGCPGGTAAVSVSPDGSAISFLFDQFSFRAVPGQAAAAGCSIRIPLTVQAGWAVQATSVDYRAFAIVPNRAFIQIRTSGFVGNNRMSYRMAAESRIVGPFTGPYDTRQNVLQGGSITPKNLCPENPELNLNISVAAVSRLPGSEFTMDSADVGGIGDGLTMNVTLKPCKVR